MRPGEYIELKFQFGIALNYYNKISNLNFQKGNFKSKKHRNFLSHAKRYQTSDIQ